MGTATADTGNTSYSSTCSPGLCASLMTGFFRYGICLSVIFSDIGVYEVNNVWSDRSFKDGREGELSADQSSILTTVY